jgi:hypothetical protein
MLKCSCCEKLTVYEEYDICTVCGWQKDDVQESDSSSTIGANAMSLSEARYAYRETGVVSSKMRAIGLLKPPPLSREPSPEGEGKEKE